MKKQLLLCLVALSLCASLFAQPNLSPTSGVSTHAYLQNNGRQASPNTLSFNPDLAPFYHGVASGDPLSDRVIIWTRVTTTDPSVSGTWRLATDTAFQNVVQSGSFITDASRDYTVKVDVAGLQSNTSYYYEFQALNKTSLIGRTKTAPTANEETHLRFAVVSCQNYEAGFFNAFGRIAARNDLHAMIHLGDYIYEYPRGAYGDTSLSNTGLRAHDTLETVTEEQYRARYSLYRLDKDLRAAHQQHPIIAVWDDHESANDAHANGAENHDSATEGAWATRKAVSRKVYYEWMPIRENAPNAPLYRTLHYGNLMDLIMIDTRITGRDAQINDVTNPALYAPTRSMLGSTQRTWFFNQLNNSTAKWKIVGNQVIFSEFNVGWAAPAVGTTPTQLESQFLDIWDGYPAERKAIIDEIRDNNIDNVVFLTGDFHSSFAYDVTDTVTNAAAGYTPVPNYNPSTGAGSVAVEFATPSISSANFDENTNANTAALLEGQINNPLGIQPNDNPNPHMKFVDLDQHGYFLLDVKDDSTQANWFFVDRIDIHSTIENFGGAQYSKDSENHLTTAAAASMPKAVQDAPAPAKPLIVGTKEATQYFEVLGTYPNPADHRSLLQYALNQTASVEIDLYNMQGQRVRTLIHQTQSPGIYDLHIGTSDLPAGQYFYQIRIDGKTQTYKLLIAH